MVSRTGQCLCGGVKYEMKADPAVNGICNCKNCQRQAGSAFSTISAIAKADFEISGETLKTYMDPDTDSGNQVTRVFCGTCGSPIYSQLEGQPDMIYLKSGTLDDTSGWAPQFNVWCQSKQDWVIYPDGVPQVDKQ